MKVLSKKLLVFAIGALALVAVDQCFAKETRGSGEQRRTSDIRKEMNAWTVGLAGGLLEGAPIRFATEIARVADDGDNLHVLPIVTRGPTENVESLLYLRGVDAALINADVLAEFKTVVPNVQQKISFILNLFPSELHIFRSEERRVGKECRSRWSRSD